MMGRRDGDQRPLVPPLKSHALPNRSLQALHPLSVRSPQFYADDQRLRRTRLFLRLPIRSACSHNSSTASASRFSGATRGSASSSTGSRGGFRLSLALSLCACASPDSADLLFRLWQRLLVRQSFLAIPYGMRFLRRPLLWRLPHQLLAPRIWRMARW